MSYIVGRARRTDVGIEAINDILTHVDKVIEDRMLCGCALCLRWEVVCNIVLAAWERPKPPSATLLLAAPPE